MNVPYTTTLGELSKEHPYINTSPNRSQRRELLQKNPFKGNKKGISLSVGQNLKYERTVQTINLKDGGVKRINHQMPI